MDIIVRQNIRPDLRIGASEKISCLRTKHGIFISYTDELKVVLAFLVRDECKIWITLLTIFTDGEGIVQIVLFQKLLGIIVGIFVLLVRVIL